MSLSSHSAEDEVEKHVCGLDGGLVLPQQTGSSQNQKFREGEPAKENS